MLFGEVLKNKTKENADNTLKNYRVLLRIAGEEYSPKVTATYSLEPKSAPSSPSRQTEQMERDGSRSIRQRTESRYDRLRPLATGCNILPERRQQHDRCTCDRQFEEPVRPALPESGSRPGISLALEKRRQTDIRKRIPDDGLRADGRF